MENKKYYWIKIKDSFMTSEKVDFLMSQKNGANYVVLYQCLCLKCANTNGELVRTINEVIIPFDENKIVRDCKWFDIDTVRVALSLYKKLGLIYEQENGNLKISNFENMVGYESQYAIKQREYRENKLPALKNGIKRLNREMLALPNGKTIFVDETKYGGNGALCLDLANCTCEICGSKDDILIHHNNGESNDINDLFCLCKSCHDKVHNGGYTLSTHLYTTTSTQDIRDKILDIRDNKEKIELDKSNSLKKKSFEKPTVEMIKTYIEEVGYQDVDAETFYNFYESKGWYIGKNKMKNWKCAIATWHKKNQSNNKNKTQDCLIYQEGCDY